MVFLGLGTNLGDRQANLLRAIDLLNRDQINITRQSSIYESAPRDVLDQPWFFNMVVECESRYFPMQLMTRLLRIERAMGRDRRLNAIRRGPRLIDIDLLLYRNAVIQTPRLTLPHPRMSERRFVLEPLLELTPDLKDPRTKEPLSRALAAVRDQKLSKLT
jgi:2-amino-4-hydroxy-6-hydroxymethyldihydropteridine diphosphokinase